MRRVDLLFLPRAKVHGVSTESRSEHVVITICGRLFPLLADGTPVRGALRRRRPRSDMTCKNCLRGQG